MSKPSALCQKPALDKSLRICAMCESRVVSEGTGHGLVLPGHSSRSIQTVPRHLQQHEAAAGRAGPAGCAQRSRDPAARLCRPGRPARPQSQDSRHRSPHLNGGDPTSPIPAPLRGHCQSLKIKVLSPIQKPCLLHPSVPGWAHTACLYLGSWLPQRVPLQGSHWQSSLLGLRTSLPVRAQPKKKKKVDVKKEQAQKERMKKRLKKLEKAAPELIPIEDFITPLKYSESNRVRSLPALSPEEAERRVLLLKKWCLFKQKQDEAEKKAIKALVESQQEALRELQLESEELYQAAVLRDEALFPFQRDGPSYTPPLPGYDPPEGKCVDITKVYTQ
ncbi:39S ribosomal protein L40, mitochondrial [Passer montanus]|uniref:39S ribosomal protein L40, mitochondrial n=1 Tax=Passer montanus TaxID=9160 RepID=UPI0019604DC2|nr:39S ribosomal protein L40, mitochondrial [Passer montanus]